MGSTGASCELGALPLIGASCELKASNEGASGELAASVNVNDLVMKCISGLQKRDVFCSAIYTYTGWPIKYYRPLILLLMFCAITWLLIMRFNSNLYRMSIIIGKNLLPSLVCF